MKNENHHYSSMDMFMATEPFILVAEPHAKRVDGFPLDSLSIDIGTGKGFYGLRLYLLLLCLLKYCLSQVEAPGKCVCKQLRLA